ncbi:hypothetical protein [Thalassobacillus hwangdonensis]|uniref:VOC domain-containing protein n=1 Tax=Thalassobacillus hwangdonensis TaxID=546108 RepID=A0ABW3L577_9BACI
MLFHYHFWTPYVEETEKFYIEQGFTVHQRIGRHEGEFQSFHPPLDWEDFREKQIAFRIIEVKKGSVNITFGLGKKPMFDHIGFLVSQQQHDEICTRAEEMGWKTDPGERRTFIGTPFEFRVELQTHRDAIDEGNADFARIDHMKISTPEFGLEEKLTQLLGREDIKIASVTDEDVMLKEVTMWGMSEDSTDPNGVLILQR